MSVPYDRYYKAKLDGALVFQDFVVDAAWSMLGLAIVQYGSELYQKFVGESRTGVEIKFDEKFGSTGNLWIEVAEKARPREGEYFPSGIYRNDNTWLYCIGDYNTIFFFAKSLLRSLSTSGKWPLRENNTHTSKGFLLNTEQSQKYAAAVLRPNAKEKVAKAIGDISQLGKELHLLAKSNPNQLSLFEKPA